MIEIDGAIGEGGGQVLRTTLALSVIKGLPVHISNIRANRSKPGLQPQHLAAVQAAAAICGAEVSGAEINSRDVFFDPGIVQAGRYNFSIGTAGSTSLVIQTVFMPLTHGRDTSYITVSGGTHVPFSPSFDYLESQWMPVLQDCGYRARLMLQQAGFYPEGGGKVQATIRTVDEIQPLERMERGALLRIRGISAVANLDEDIARRQKLQALRQLEPLCRDSKIEISHLQSTGKGTMLLLQAEFEHATASFSSLGALGKRAEKVADEAVKDLNAFLATDGAVDPYLADQLLLPLAFASGKSRFRTSRITRHLTTMAEILRLLDAAQVTIDGDEGQPGSVTIVP